MLLAKEVDFAADYVRRGRAHRNLTNVEVREAWVAAFRAYSREPGPGPLQSALQDFQAELDLRGIAPPFDAVQVDLNRLVEAAKRVSEQLRADPERLEDINRDLRVEIAEFKVARDQSKS
jgi:hypothetical protein